MFCPFEGKGPTTCEDLINKKRIYFRNNMGSLNLIRFPKIDFQRNGFILWFVDALCILWIMPCVLFSCRHLASTFFNLAGYKSKWARPVVSGKHKGSEKAVKGIYCVKHNVKDMVDFCELGMYSIPSLIFSDFVSVNPCCKSSFCWRMKKI